MIWDLNISHEKVFDFVSFPLSGFTLVIKLSNFEFESLLKYFNLFIKETKKNI